MRSNAADGQQLIRRTERGRRLIGRQFSWQGFGSNDNQVKQTLIADLVLLN